MKFDVHMDVKINIVAIPADVQAALAAIPALKAVVDQLFIRSTKIMATQDDAALQIEAHGSVLDKISGETTTLVQQVRELRDAAAAAGAVTPRLQAAIDNIMGKATAIDVLVDDIAPNPTPTPPDPAPTP